MRCLAMSFLKLPALNSTLFSEHSANIHELLSLRTWLAGKFGASLRSTERIGGKNIPRTPPLSCRWPVHRLLGRTAARSVIAISMRYVQYPTWRFHPQERVTVKEIVNGELGVAASPAIPKGKE